VLAGDGTERTCVTGCGFSLVGEPRGCGFSYRQAEGGRPGVKQKGRDSKTPLNQNHKGRSYGSYRKGRSYGSSQKLLSIKTTKAGITGVTRKLLSIKTMKA